jgi:hypothetical protein
MQWYYSKNSAQLGPITLDELKAKLASGEVAPSDVVWREGMQDWRPAGTLPELAVAPSVAQPVSASPATGQLAESSPYRAPGTVSHAPGMPIPNYLWQSIVVTIFCCWPLGIPAIVYAAKVDGLSARGDTAGAMAASAEAKKWCKIALIAWVVLIVIYGLIMGLAIITGNASSSSVVR